MSNRLTIEETAKSNLRSAMLEVDRIEATEEKVRDALLAEREKTHGSFSQTAGVSQEIKGVLARAGAHGLSPVQQEALDMIASKLARILSGNADEPDHWRDIAGYAKLVEESLT